MGKNKRPILRSLLIGCSIFVVLMCSAFSAQTYLTFSSWYYKQYNETLAHVISGLEHTIDVDDLQKCVHTQTPSPKFDELQAFFNEYIDDYGLAYLYVCIPRADGVMVSVCSATSAAERAAGEEDWPLLYEDNSYTPESIQPYLDAWDASSITYFETHSDWGLCYTACKPLTASDGEIVALLCADLFTKSMHTSINEYVICNVLLSCSLGIIFGALLLLWLHRDVTSPIRKLEESAMNFAQGSRELRDPTALLFDDPHIHTQNEIESLSDAIATMAENMQDYVKAIAQAELSAQSAREIAEGMSRLAFEDVLTHARSKAAYTQAVKRLTTKDEFEQLEFAILMIDLNNLKYINDTFGHDHGDGYLTGACGLIADVLGDTPVYRTGGDEFVAILQGDDYLRANELLRELQDRFGTTQADEGVNPWQRYSAACGMAKRRRNESYEDVFVRADRTMYRNKAKMKARMKNHVMPR